MAEQWERQRGESALQYAYFKTYLDMGVTRTIAKVREKCGKTAGYFEKLSARNNWVSRADAYDRYIDEISRKENIEAIKKANKENIQLAQAIKYAVGKKAQALIKKIKEAGSTEELDEILSEINWNVLPTLANTAVEIERKAYGVNNEILNVSVEGNENVDVELSLNMKRKAIYDKLKSLELKTEPNEPQGEHAK